MRTRTTYITQGFYYVNIVKSSPNVLLRAHTAEYVVPTCVVDDLELSELYGVPVPVDGRKVGFVHPLLECAISRTHWSVYWLRFTPFDEQVSQFLCGIQTASGAEAACAALHGGGDGGHDSSGESPTR